MRRVVTLRRATASGVALAVLLLMRSTSAQVEGERFESPEWRIRISVPEHWRMSAQTSYPNVLLWMYRSNPPGKMLLSAQRLEEPVTSVQYAEKTIAQLVSLGYEPQKPQYHAATGAYWVELDDGETFLRQALLVSGGIGYSLTLSAPESRIRTQHLRAFDYALRSMQRIEESEEEPARPPSSSEAPAASDAMCPAPPSQSAPSP